MTCDKDINIDDVIELLKKYVIGIKVYKQGSIASSWRIVAGKIFSVDSDNFVEVDMLEFIEVRNSRLSFKALKTLNELKRK